MGLKVYSGSGGGCVCNLGRLNTVNHQSGWYIWNELTHHLYIFIIKEVSESIFTTRSSTTSSSNAPNPVPGSGMARLVIPRCS